MKNVKIHDLAAFSSVPFMDIRPTDVLISRNLILKLLTGMATDGDDFLLWAQSSCFMTDVFLSKKKMPLEVDKFGNPVFEEGDCSTPKIDAYLPPKDAEYYFGEWEGKRVKIPQYENEIEDQSISSPELSIDSCGRIRFGSTASSDLTEGINYGYYDNCWVLRKTSGLDVHPMALAHFVSDSVRQSRTKCNTVDEALDHILDLDIDQEELIEFHNSQAQQYPKNVRYGYRDILQGDHANEWGSIFNIISQPIITIRDLEPPLRKMGMAHWGVADDFMELNNRLGALFLTPTDFETFVKSGGIGHISLKLNDPEDYPKWLKHQIGHRGQTAVTALYEVYAILERWLFHFSSSPIQRVFAKKLLPVLPEKKMVIKKSDMVLKEAFFDEYGSDIKRGIKVHKGASKGGAQKANEKKLEIERKVSDVREETMNKHNESHHLSFTRILTIVAKDVDIGVSTLKNYGVIKKNFPDW